MLPIHKMKDNTDYADINHQTFIYMQNLSKKLQFYPIIFLQLNKLHCKAEVEGIKNILITDDAWFTNIKKYPHS